MPTAIDYGGIASVFTAVASVIGALAALVGAIFAGLVALRTRMTNGHTIGELVEDTHQMTVRAEPHHSQLGPSTWTRGRGRIRTMTDTNANPTAPDDADQTATAPDPAATAAAVDAHTDQIRNLEQRVNELEAELARVGSALTDTQQRSAKPAPDDATPATLAADENGLQPGHAGLGTGDGPAGNR